MNTSLLLFIYFIGLCLCLFTVGYLHEKIEKKSTRAVFICVIFWPFALCILAGIVMHSAVTTNAEF